MENIVAEKTPPSPVIGRVMIVVLSVLLVAAAGFAVYQISRVKMANNNLEILKSEKALLEKKAADSDQKISELQTKTAESELKLADFESSTLKLLSLIKETCEGDPLLCINKIIARPMEQGLSEAKGGLCALRSGSANAPAYNDPNVGKGYAKLVKEGYFSAQELMSACTKEDYSTLLKAYCQQNKEPAQMAVLGVNKFGAVESSGCSGFGCGSVSCP